MSRGPAAERKARWDRALACPHPPEARETESDKSEVCGACDLILKPAMRGLRHRPGPWVQHEADVVVLGAQACRRCGADLMLPLWTPGPVYRRGLTCVDTRPEAEEVVQCERRP